MLPWALSAAGFQATRRLAGELGVRIHMHTAETAAFADLIEKAHGHRSNVRVYHDGGRLGPRATPGRSWLAPEEVDAIAATGTAVLLDPTAAMFIGAGMPPLLRLLAAGVPAGLATNGPAANGSQDMFESMNVAGLSKLAAQDGRAFTQQRALDLATIEGARALGLDSAIGSLEPGKRADIVVVDLQSPFVAPVLDVVVGARVRLQGTRRARRHDRRPHGGAQRPAADGRRGRHRAPRRPDGAACRRTLRADVARKGRCEG